MTKSSFYKNIGIITIFVFTAFLVLFKSKPQYEFPYWFLLPVYFIIVTVGTHQILLNALRDKPKLFTSYYMGTMGAKLFLTMAVMVIYILLFKKNAVPFLISTLILYFTYNIYEIVVIRKLSSKKD